MRVFSVVFIVTMALGIISCSNERIGLTVVNSQSFNGMQISLAESLQNRLNRDSVPAEFLATPEENEISKLLDALVSEASGYKTNPKDTSWNTFVKKWEDFRSNSLPAPNLSNKQLIGKWAELNVMLLKLSGDARFGDVIEKLVYNSPVPVISEQVLKSVVYTHVFDKIYINVLCSSGMNYQHTTGGTVKLTQETNLPDGHEMLLRCEVDDTRYMDVYIRIPEWAVNPTVTHGNVKYVPHPGEYCEISRKWKDGDEISVSLMN